MMMNRMFRIALLSSAIVSMTIGCGDDLLEDAAGMRVIGLSTHELVIGQTVEVYVRDLPSEDGQYRVFFDGVYRNDNGDVEEVHIGQTPILDGDAEIDGKTFKVLRISRFGPFANPFSDSNRPGTFEGTVSLTVQSADGSFVETQSPTNVELDVNASIIIEEFQPIDAECGAPALRGLAGLAYRMTVRAVGIKPVQYRYEITRVNGAVGTVTYEHTFEQPVDRDSIGDEEPVIFNQIDDADQFYATGIRVIATDANGQTVETAMPFTVHRPIEVIMMSKKARMAERYEPTPVSGCIPGGIGTQVRYSESRTESRQRSVSLTVRSDWSSTNGSTQTNSWQQGISEGQSSSQTLGGSEKEDERTQESFGVTYGTSEANRMNYSTNDGESWGWSRSEGETNTEYENRLNTLYGEGSFSTTVGATGEGSVPGFAKVTGSASTTTGVRAGGSSGWDSGTARTNSVNRGHNMNGSSSETRGFGSTLTENNSQSLGGSYALSRSRSRTFQDQEARSMSRTWDFSGSASMANTVSEGMSDAESSTWSESISQRTVQEFSGRIPRNQVGMFYRQTTRMVKRAEVRAYNQCGLAEHIGELQFNEWEWAPDLALSESCDDGTPPTNLEPAACFIPPCG
jgi:hypothetical protein